LLRRFKAPEKRRRQSGVRVMESAASETRANDCPQSPKRKRTSAREKEEIASVSHLAGKIRMIFDRPIGARRTHDFAKISQAGR